MGVDDNEIVLQGEAQTASGYSSHEIPSKSNRPLACGANTNAATTGLLDEGKSLRAGINAVLDVVCVKN